MAGVAPKDRPLLFTRKDGVLFGLNFNMEERSGHDSSYMDYQRYKFSILLHKNFGKAVGFDFNFDYNDLLDLENDEHYSSNFFRGTMRLTLVDAGPLAISTAIDYVNHGDLADADDPRITQPTVTGISRRVLILVFQKRLSFPRWTNQHGLVPSDTHFKLEQRILLWRGTLA
jgi:hypothetical protein